MTPEQHAEFLRDAVRRYVAGGGEQHLDTLVHLAKVGRRISVRVEALCDRTERNLNEEDRDRQLLLEELITDLRLLTDTLPSY